MLTSTFGVVIIVISGFLALAALEGIVLYAAVRPTWKTGPAARPAHVSRRAVAAPAAQQVPEQAAADRVPLGTGGAARL